MIKVAFVTGNKQKYEIAKQYLQRSGGTAFELYQKDVNIPEIQGVSVEKIAQQSSVWACEKLGVPVITSDVGFHIEALNGFPGPFVKYINTWLTSENILSLMKGNRRRKAFFTDSIAYTVPGGETVVFSSITKGTIATELPRKTSGWMIDDVFIPDGYEIPLSMLSKKQRDSIWNTDRWDKMALYIKGDT